jgi:modulator of FtsH protease HflC
MNTSILRRPAMIAVILLALLILLSMSVSVVPETKQAVVTNYGNYQRTINPYRKSDVLGQTTQAGLTFRMPFFEQIHMIDKRVMNVDMDTQELQSTDQSRLRVDAFARFRIVNPLQMYKSARTEERLKQQLATFLGSAVRGELGKRNFSVLLSPERGEVMNNIRKALDTRAATYGVKIVDVRIKRADLPETTLKSAYARMESAREQEATRIEAQGQKEAQIIRATAQAEAARIYAESYGKDPEFYDFYRAMQSYRTTFNQGEGEGSTNIILSPSNDYLRKFETGR